MHPIQSRPIDPVLGQREVARVMGVSVDTVRRRCAAGDLRIIRLSPRRLGIRASEVDRYLREREGLPPQHDGGQRDAPRRAKP
jgi:excisionase family DNA binding protein